MWGIALTGQRSAGRGECTMTVTVIGIGSQTVPSAGRKALESAELVVGGRRHLDSFAPRGVSTMELGALDPALDALKGYVECEKQAVVLASGDPGYFGILRAMRAAGITARVVPSVSSVARLAALIGRPWDDVTVVSAHGRDLGPALNLCRARRAVAVLTAPGAGPTEIGAGLAGWRRTLIVGESLGTKMQRVSTVEPQQAANRLWQEPNVLLCLASDRDPPQKGWLAGGEPSPPRRGWALAEAEFAHRDGMVTKSEVRALALARLAPRPGSLIWDVGAGSGSVGVECARLGAAVIAVERDPGQCVRIIANASSHEVDIRTVDAAAPDALRGLPTPDAIFVGGGGERVISACAGVGARRVVVALAGIDGVPAARDALRDNGYSVDGVSLSASRMADLPSGASRLLAANPVFLLWGSV
ncbi:MAG: precorrin-6y C5,15-methyltransferase (decarboxylating) subunit CbiE [Sciscionella sp.]